MWIRANNSSGGGGTIYLNCRIYRLGPSSKIVMGISSNSVKVKAVYGNGGTAQYKNNAVVAGSNDLTNWTVLYTFPSKYATAYEETQTIDTSQYEYIGFYSSTTQNNYQAAVTLTVTDT